MISLRHSPARPALQARSRRTLDALLDALDRLLRDRPFESITVLELAREAKVSTGAFYARFASKEDLLPELYSRYQDSLRAITERELDPSQWAPLSPHQRLERLTRFLRDLYRRRSWLLRAVTIHSRQRYSPKATEEPSPTTQVELLERFVDCLAVAPTVRPDATRDELQFAVYTAITLTREAVLFPNLPMAAFLGLNEKTILARLPILLQKQLGLASAAS